MNLQRYVAIYLVPYIKIKSSPYKVFPCQKIYFFIFICSPSLTHIMYRLNECKFEIAIKPYNT